MYSMKAVHSGPEEYDAIGFDPPARVRRMIEPQAPTELSAKGYSNGVNILGFKGNNRPNTVRYLIEAKVGDAADYAIIGVSKAQKFKHENVTPGVPCQYRVRAQAARGPASECSNEAAVYGTRTFLSAAAANVRTRGKPR